MLGWVNYAQMGKYLERSDVFLFPTLEDGCSMVPVEAMVFGKPILCSKWAGTSEMVIDGAFEAGRSQLFYKHSS